MLLEVYDIEKKRENGARRPLMFLGAWKTEGAPRGRAGYLATLVVTRWALVRQPSVSLPDSTALELHLRTPLDCPPPNSTLVLSPNSTRTQVVSSDATPPTPLTPDSNTQLWRSPHRLAKETKERDSLTSSPTLSLGVPTRPFVAPGRSPLPSRRAGENSRRVLGFSYF